jgi:hypothetical protein
LCLNALDFLMAHPYSHSLGALHRHYITDFPP